MFQVKTFFVRFDWIASISTQRLCIPCCKRNDHTIMAYIDAFKIHQQNPSYQWVLYHVLMCEKILSLWKSTTVIAYYRKWIVLLLFFVFFFNVEKSCLANPFPFVMPFWDNFEFDINIFQPRTTAPGRGRLRSRPEREADRYHDDLAYRQLRKDVPPVRVEIPGYRNIMLVSGSPILL